MRDSSRLHASKPGAVTLAALLLLTVMLFAFGCSKKAAAPPPAPTPAPVAIAPPPTSAAPVINSFARTLVVEAQLNAGRPGREDTPA